jgi:hypothetical protein
MFAHLAGGILTNQFYEWAGGQMPLQTYMAWPVEDSVNLLAELKTQCPPAFNLALSRFNGAQLAAHPQPSSLALGGLQMIAPEITAAMDEGRSFLLLSCFPALGHNPPPPAALWEQLNAHTNLIYYDWDLSGPRLQQLHMLGAMLLEKPGSRSPALKDALETTDRWRHDFRAVGSPTVTQALLTGPAEVSIERVSPLGFTGLELYYLSDWLGPVLH